jgi:hypothetical protein
MDAAELLEWQHLEGTDPWGQTRDDWRIAHLAAALAGAFGAKKKDGTGLTAADLVVQFHAREVTPQSPEQIEAMLRDLVTAHNRQARKTRSRQTTAARRKESSGDGPQHRKDHRRTRTPR